MKSTCLSVCRQGWLGVPLFLLGVVTLAFSQLSLETQTESMTAEELSQFVSQEIDRLTAVSRELQRDQSSAFFADRRQAIVGNLSQVAAVRGNSDPAVVRLQANLQSVEAAWKARSQEAVKGLASVEGRLIETAGIYKDLDDNFAGRVEEAKPALEVLRENLIRTENELAALAQLSRNARNDALASLNSLSSESGELVGLAVPKAPINPRSTIASSGSTPNRFAPSIKSSFGQVGGSKVEPEFDDGSSEVIDRLKNELATSKSIQSELSADTAGLQGDLRKAYREIVTLQASLKESQMLVDELETSRQSLWKTEDGSPPTAQTVSRQINRLEDDLQKARDDLRLSRQTLLMEQQRSNAMISSVTNELERTRAELDDARTAAFSSGADSGRLLAMQRELDQAKRALQMAQTAPKDKTQESYLNLQEELKKALGEVTRMQIELADKEVLEEQLNRLRNSIETTDDLTSGKARAEYVNKLMVDLNDVKRELLKARAENREERKSLTQKVTALEDELAATKIELETTLMDFAKTKESIAKREFEDALTIQRLEEEAQLAQSALRDASLGKLPAIPFVNEMEDDLASSEARIKALSERFDAEQAKATEVIDGLQVELDAAVLRQKRALDQLARREIDLQGKERDLQQVEQEKKKLQEELQVVTVIAGQLKDLNDVLETTKNTQNSQSGSMDQIIKSLRDELNQAKVELVFALEEKDKLDRDSSSKIQALENQLENTRKELILKDENLADLSANSQELMLDLKNELDVTRDQLSRMKKAGMGGSLETEKAVSQLQEALGTIQVLQESLDEAEQVNLEVDTLRADLANAMETQMAEIQRSEDQKAQLSKKTKDLEAEIAMLREQREGTGVGFQKLNAQLREQLQASQAQVAELEQRAAQAEDSGITSLVGIEEELAAAKNKNQELQAALEKGVSGKNRTIELLENDLKNAIDKLKAAGQSAPSISPKDMDELEVSLASADQTISALQEAVATEKGKQAELQGKLASAMEKLAALEQSPAQPQIIEKEVIVEKEIVVEKPAKEFGDFIKLEEELADAQNTISELQDKVDVERESRKALEEQLALASSDPKGTEVAAPAGEEVEAIKKLLAEKEAREADLEKQLNDAREQVNEKEAELELAKALTGEMETLQRKLEDAQKAAENPSVVPSPLAQEERDTLQAEIDLLTKQLADAKGSLENPGSTEALAALQKQLQEAVAESVEMQTELEETKNRLASIEAADATQSPELQTVIANAKMAEQQGQARVAELTRALRNSESLRKEMEELLTQEEPQPVLDIAADPRFIEIQKEMLLLQQDLLAARGMTDPAPEGMTAELAAAQADNARLNEEFKSAMDDFGRIKEKVALLEEENRRLQEEGGELARAKAKEDLAALQSRIGGLSSENSSLRVELGERENRIASLRDELARAQVSIPGVAPDNAALRAQVIRLEGIAQSSKDAESRARMDLQRSQGDLQTANQRIASLETNLRQAQSMARNVPSRIPSLTAPLPAVTPPPTAATPSLSNTQIAELTRLRDQNQRLQEQVQSMTSMPGRDQIDRKLNALNQQNLTAQIQLDQERAKVEDLRKQLSEARDIKQAVVERGQSANIKVGMLNQELANARDRISSLENALVAAREAIRILQKGDGGSSVKVSVPSSSFRNTPQVPTFPRSTPSRSPRSRPLGGIVPSESTITPFVQNVPKGKASLQLSAEVQFLNNKNRPAGYTEFFLLQQDLDSVMKSSRIRIPSRQDIDSYAELWARSVQRGYRFPGVAASIRNALATSSLARIKTNSVGKANLANLKSGKYYVVGASTLGQVGVVWSKPITLSAGSNQMSLDLRDAEWAE